MINFSDIALFVIFVFVTYCEIKLLWEGIRSLMKLPLNLPPSKSRWAKVEIHKESENVSEYYSSDDFGVIKNNGIPIVSRPEKPKVQTTSFVTYDYDGKTRKATIIEGSGKGYGKQLYCKKSDPDKVKIYTPQPPKAVSAAISMLIIDAGIIFFELVFLQQLLSEHL